MVISGAPIYVNSVGVKLFSDLTFYMAGENLLVWCCAPDSASALREFNSLYSRNCVLLVTVASVDGIVSNALYFRGLEISLITRIQFLLIALLAGAFLRESWKASI
jgi:hypothetical protein